MGLESVSASEDVIGDLNRPINSEISMTRSRTIRTASQPDKLQFRSTGTIQHCIIPVIFAACNCELFAALLGPAAPWGYAKPNNFEGNQLCSVLDEPVSYKLDDDDCGVTFASYVCDIRKQIPDDVLGR